MEQKINEMIREFAYELVGLSWLSMDMMNLRQDIIKVK